MSSLLLLVSPSQKLHTMVFNPHYRFSKGKLAGSLHSPGINIFLSFRISWSISLSSLWTLSYNAKNIGVTSNMLEQYEMSNKYILMERPVKCSYIIRMYGCNGYITHKVPRGRKLDIGWYRLSLKTWFYLALSIYWY